MLPLVVAGLSAAAIAAYGVLRDREGLLAALFVVGSLYLLGFAVGAFHHVLVLLGGALGGLATSAVPGAWAWPWWQRGLAVLAVLALVSVALLLLFSGPTYIGLDRYR
jgi:hypothetical protein